MLKHIISLCIYNIKGKNLLFTYVNAENDHDLTTLPFQPHLPSVAYAGDGVISSNFYELINFAIHV